MQDTTDWPTLNGACVIRGSLVRLHVTSPQDLASRLTTSHHTPPNEATLIDLLSKVEVLHGWVLNHESRVVDGHVVESSWHVFVFGLLSTFIVPSHMLHVASVLVDAIALRDLLLAFRCKHGCMATRRGHGGE